MMAFVRRNNMEAAHWFLMLWISCFSSITGSISQVDNMESCTSLGFRETLLCSTCQDLEKFVPDKEIVDDCKKCCAEESDMETIIHYVSARLQVCK